MAREGQKPAPPDFCQVRDKTDSFAYLGGLAPAPDGDLKDGFTRFAGAAAGQGLNRPDQDPHGAPAGRFRGTG